MKRSLEQLLGLYAVTLLGLVFVTSMLFSGWFTSVERLFGKCWLGQKKPGVGDETPLKRIRGSNYFLTPSGQHQGYCLVTTWAVIHIALYVVIGYMFPDRFWETFAIGLLFEGAEWITFDCHDLLDVAWNSIGFIIGQYLARRRA